MVKNAKARRDVAAKYKELCAQLCERIGDCDYQMLSVWMNYVVFGKHIKDLRKVAAKKKLTELLNLESTLVIIIEMGYVRSMDDIKKFLQAQLVKKNGGLVLPSREEYLTVRKLVQKQ